MKAQVKMFQSILRVFSQLPQNCSEKEFGDQSEQDWQSMNQDKMKKDPNFVLLWLNPYMDSTYIFLKI